MATYTGTDSDAPFPAAIKFEDAAGNAVSPDDIPVWQSSDPTIASVDSTTPDGTGATIKLAGRAGSCTITATSVNKAGTTIVMSGAVIIAAGDATQGEIEFPSQQVTPSVPASDPTAPSTSATPGDSVPAGSTADVPPTGDTTTAQSASTAPAASTVGAS